MDYGVSAQKSKKLNYVALIKMRYFVGQNETWMTNSSDFFQYPHRAAKLNFRQTIIQTTLLLPS